VRESLVAEPVDARYSTPNNTTSAVQAHAST